MTAQTSTVSSGFKWLYSLEPSHQFLRPSEQIYGLLKLKGLGKDPVRKVFAIRTDITY